VKSIFLTQAGKAINSTVTRRIDAKKVMYNNTSKKVFILSACYKTAFPLIEFFISLMI
jgi:hypothetical protein